MDDQNKVIYTKDDFTIHGESDIKWADKSINFVLNDKTYKLESVSFDGGSHLLYKVKECNEIREG